MIFTFFEPCIVIYMCKKNKQNVHFLVNNLIRLYCNWIKPLTKNVVFCWFLMI